MWIISNDLKNLKGNILDIGCLMGGAGFLMSKANNNGNTILIDTFASYIDNEKFYDKKYFNFKLVNTVKNYIKLFNLKKTKVLKGVFPTDFKKKNIIKKIKICHIYVNTYMSTKKSFHFINKKNP